MAELITMFLSGLTERSQYAVTLKEADGQGQRFFLSCFVTEWSLLESFLLISDLWVVFYFSTDDPTFLKFKKGELIIIVKDDEFSHQHGWLKGQNERTKQTGAVPTEAILILPTLSKPTNEVMVRRCQWRILQRWLIVPTVCWVLNVLHVSLFQSLLNLPPNQRKDIIKANQKETGTLERLAPATLKAFSLEYFRYLEITSILLHSAADQQRNAHRNSTDNRNTHLVSLILQAAH